MTRFGQLFLIAVVSIALSACTGRRARAGRGGDAATVDSPTAMCGNGMRDGTELCDGEDLGGLDCRSFRFSGGTLSCASSCNDYNFSRCDGERGRCGNDTAEPGELCDGPDLAEATCAGLGMDSGILTCEPNCLRYDTSACGTTSELAPEILSFTASSSSLSEEGSLVLSLTATDPEGIEDIAEVAVVDPESGLRYGTMSSRDEGRYEMMLNWSQVNAVRTIEFDGAGSRELRAIAKDRAGNTAVDSVGVTLFCPGNAACAGNCTSLASVRNCGGCGVVCGDMASCVSSEGSYACACPTDFDFCDGGASCVSLTSNRNCGRCGDSCGGGSACERGEDGYACACPGANEEVCGGLCTVVTTDTNCGGCGVRCPTGQSCASVDGTYSCATGYDQMAPSQTIAWNGGTNTFDFTGVPAISRRATITITAAGDFDQSSETASVRVGGTVIGTFTYGSCRSTQTFSVPDISLHVISASVAVTFTTTGSVDDQGCAGQTETVAAQLTI